MAMSKKTNSAVILTLAIYVSGIEGGLADQGVTNILGRRLDDGTTSDKTESASTQDDSLHQQRQLAAQDPDKFLSIDARGQGYDAAVAGVGTVLAGIEFIKDPSLKTAGETLGHLASALPMLTLLPVPWGLVGGVLFGAVGGMMQAHGAPEDPANAAVLSGINKGFAAVNKKINKVIDITTETLELVRETRNIVKEELKLQFSDLRDINALYKEAQIQFDKARTDNSTYRLDQIRLPLKKAFQSKELFYASLSGDHFGRTLQHLIETTMHTGTFCETANRVQWYLGTRQQLYWLLTMNAQFNEDPTVLGRYIKDYTDDLSRDMSLYDEKIKAWGSNYLIYAIQMTFEECQAKGMGHSCNNGNYDGSGCKCSGTWRKNPFFVDEAKTASPSALIDGSLKTDCYYTPYSCPAAGEHVHLFNGQASGGLRRKLGLFQHWNVFKGTHYELTSNYRQEDCGNDCATWAIHQVGDKFAFYNVKHKHWLKHGSEGNPPVVSGARGNNEVWMLTPVGLSKEPKPYGTGTDFDRVYIKKDDRVYLWEENNMGQVQYKMLPWRDVSSGLDYTYTFLPQRTNGASCAPIQDVLGQPPLLEAQPIEQVDLKLVSRTPSVTETTLVPIQGTTLALSGTVTTTSEAPNKIVEQISTTARGSVSGEVTSSARLTMSTTAAASLIAIAYVMVFC